MSKLIIFCFSFGLSILHNDIDDMSSPNDANIDSLKYEKVKENKDEPNTNPFIDKLNTASSEPSVLNENNNDDKFGENIGTVVIESRSDTTESPLVENQIKDDNQKKDLNENLVPNEESIVKDEDKKSVSLLGELFITIKIEFCPIIPINTLKVISYQRYLTNE